MGMMSFFTYNGKNSKDFNILIDRAGVFYAAERDYETVEIPGRNGELTLDNGRYKNVGVTYSCSIGRSFRYNMDFFLQWLMAQKGYHRLEDSLQPEHYRLARVASAPEPDTFAHYIGGKFNIEFDCKPQRFLKSGEEAKTFTGSGTITNPTFYDALPLIRAYGTGTLAIGDMTITIDSADVYTDIDCDLQDAYKGAVNCNGNITLNSGEFFKLKPGDNGIQMTGISKIELTPRWWTI